MSPNLGLKNSKHSATKIGAERSKKTAEKGCVLNLVHHPGASLSQLFCRRWARFASRGAF
jgi:hypothetical protein